MKKRILDGAVTEKFRRHLIFEEKSEITIAKYIGDIRQFAKFTMGKVIEKSTVLNYKSVLSNKYAARSVNSKLAAINSLFNFLGWQDLKVKSLKIQKQIYSSADKTLTKSEYIRLCSAAKSNARLSLIIKTICATGIRVSELKYFTVEAVRCGTVTVSCKAKSRQILIPDRLRRMLLNYARRINTTEGIIFHTRSGKAVDRSNIWAEMKKLCDMANVSRQKVFPHNLRKLFARTFYGIEKDIAKLADILGHSSIDTTRIYIMSTGDEHRRRIEQLGLIL